MGLSMEQLTGLLGGGTPDLSALIGAAGQSDPAVGAVLSALAQQRSAAAEHDVEASREEDATGESRLAGLQARFDHLRDVARRMDAELRALRHRNAQIAAALGACPHCWGEDPACSTCGGEGLPGSAPAHRGHYRHYVGRSAEASPRPSSRLTNPFPRVIAGVPGGSQD